MTRRPNAFTLIELLVVIAMMAILASIMMPAVTATNGRARTITCESRLQEMGLALRMYAEDYGAYPADTAALLAGRYLDDPEAVRCVASDQPFHYQAPGPETAPTAPVAACCKPDAPSGSRPHESGSSLAVLLAHGKTRIIR